MESIKSKMRVEQVVNGNLLRTSLGCNDWTMLSYPLGVKLLTMLGMLQGISLGKSLGILIGMK